MSEKLRRRMASAYRRFHALCFRSYKIDAQMSRPLLRVVLRGLRAHGGREGLLEAAKLARLAEEEGELCSRGS